MFRRNIRFLMNPASSFVFLFAILLFSIQCSRKGPHQKLSPITQNGTTRGGTKTGGEAAGPEIKYSDVQPLFLKRCGRCHNQNGLANWGDEQVAMTYAKNGKLTQRIAVAKNMPPAGSPEASDLTPAERELIHQWALNIAKAKQSAPPSPSGSGPTTGPTATTDQPGGAADGAAGNGGRGTSAPGTEMTLTPPTPPPAAPPTSPAPLGLNSTLEKCAGCHGKNGLSSVSGFPHLAGQSAGYLNEQLNDFREGKRKDSTSGAMNSIASSLNKEDQAIIVAYFSDLPAPITAPLSAENVENLDIFFKKGQELAKSLSCNGCHTSGPNLFPVQSGWPNIAGQDHVYIKNQLAAFLGGERTNASTMPNLLKQRNPPLTDEEMQALGIYFQNLRPGKTESKQ